MHIPVAMSAWLSKKSDGTLGALVLGRSKFYFTLDFAECTLSWAKKPEENPKGVVEFKNMVAVTSKTCRIGN